LLSATGERLWESFEPGVVGGSGGTLVFGSDGKLYVNASGGLQAIDTATGARIWQKPGTRGQPLIDAHNRIIVVCNPGTNLCAVDADGQTHWMEQTGYPVYGTPLIDANGTIVAAGNHRLTAFNSDGTTRWSHTLSSSGFVFEPNYPVVLNGGTIYLPWANRSVLVVGTGRWRSNVYLAIDT
jgi:outer membrane protein assembly factor BamB